MKVERDELGGAIGLILSRRNLLALLAKLDGHPGSSHATLIAPCQYGYFRVSAEGDAAHYANREAGPMHPETEARL